MYYIYIEDGVVRELIPAAATAFPGVPITERYTPAFLDKCVRRDSVDGLHTDMLYDAQTDTFTEPPDPPAPEPLPDPPDPTPTEVEQLRADVDFLAAMGGVDL